jgi:hypothetical protein
LIHLYFKEFYKDNYDPTNSGVYNKRALTYVPSTRIEELAQHKPIYKGYQYALPVQTNRNLNSAKKYNATQRIIELAIHKPSKN